MTAITRIATPLAVSLVAAACTSACATSGGENGDAPADLAGCYYFERNAAAGELGLPWGVRLLDRPLEGRWPAIQQLEGVRHATTLTAEGDADHPFGFWQPLPGDSVRIGYPAGGGVSLRLAAANERLTGTAQPVGDAMPLGGGAPPSERMIVLTHARCPEDA